MTRENKILRGNKNEQREIWKRENPRQEELKKKVGKWQHRKWGNRCLRTTKAKSAMLKKGQTNDAGEHYSKKACGNLQDRRKPRQTKWDMHTEPLSMYTSNPEAKTVLLQLCSCTYGSITVKWPVELGSSWQLTSLGSNLVWLSAGGKAPPLLAVRPCHQCPETSWASKGAHVELASGE